MRILDRVVSALAREKIHALLISDAANIAYILGTRHAEGTLLCTREKNIFFTDGRFINELQSMLSRRADVELVDVAGDLPSRLKNRLRRLRVRKLGIEANKLPWASYQRLSSLLNGPNGISLVPTEELIEKVRQVKEFSEIALIRDAAALTRECFDYIRELSSGRAFSEQALALEAERFLKLKAGDTAFPPIISFDRNSSQPHHEPSNSSRLCQKILLMDIGARKSNYCSDLTQIHLKGRIPPVEKICDIVKKAKDLALKKVRVGARISEIDRAARDYISSRGYGKCFVHALGHGVGVDVHELPGINPKNSGHLEENMVFTLEPAIYLNNRFGIRLEDMVWVKGRRGEIIGDSPKEVVGHGR
jgi:Xaa-Pro aminopeptidase